MRFDWLTWASSMESPSWHVFGHDRTCSDHGPSADGHSGTDESLRSDQNVILNINRLGDERTTLSFNIMCISTEVLSLRDHGPFV